jgi:SAM-dependent methyltransferase
MTKYMQLLFFLFALFILVPVAAAGLSFAPFHTCRKRDLERILRLADLKAGDVFYDLGCGDGRVAFYVAEHSEARVIAVERVWILALWCKFKARWKRSERLKFVWDDLFKMDLSQAKTVYVYGMPRTLERKLKAKFERELPPGSRVISYVFYMRGWEPKITDQPTQEDIPIYVYEM